MAELLIRPANTVDCPAIAVLQLEATAALATLAPAGFCNIDPEESNVQELEQEFEEACGDPDCELLVAESDGIICGFVLAVIEDHADDLIAAPFMTITWLGVSTRFRRCGIAARLLAAAEQAAVKRGITTIDALVWECNPAARQLNESLGYTTLERRMVKRIDS